MGAVEDAAPATLGTARGAGDAAPARINTTTGAPAGDGAPAAIGASCVGPDEGAAPEAHGAGDGATCAPSAEGAADPPSDPCCAANPCAAGGATVGDRFAADAAEVGGDFGTAGADDSRPEVAGFWPDSRQGLGHHGPSQVAHFRHCHP
ncbi:MAG: hypothetical protein HYZ28_14855 [Myxococcales bacterium]|nr:hypothetical protein [Myxococcales bacterium]